MLLKSGFEIFDYTITGKTIEQIKHDLSGIDVLHIPGGNEFYLKAKSNESNFDEFVIDFIAKGGIYIGSSCGSIIVGTDMSPLLKLSDHTGLTNPVDTKGFGIVNFTSLPHWGSDNFRDRWINNDSFNLMFNSSAPIIALNNYEYVEVVDDQFRIIDVRNEK
jgi:dipeptidase E